MKPDDNKYDINMRIHTRDTYCYFEIRGFKSVDEAIRIYNEATEKYWKTTPYKISPDEEERLRRVEEQKRLEKPLTTKKSKVEISV